MLIELKLGPNSGLPLLWPLQIYSFIINVFLVTIFSIPYLRYSVSAPQIHSISYSTYRNFEMITYLVYWIIWNYRVQVGKAMAPYSSTFAWKIPRAGEPGRLQSMGSLRVGRLNDFTFTFHFHALEKEMATHSSVLAWRISGTGEPCGLCLWVRTESDTTEAT